MDSFDKAVELISDFSEMQSTSSDLSNLHEYSKIFAKYAANTAKWSHKSDSKKWLYWEEVKKEIDKL